MPDNVSVLGIDQALANCGVALVNGQDRIVLASVFRTKPRDLPHDRVLQLYDALAALVRRHQPVAIAVETYLQPVHILEKVGGIRTYVRDNWVLGACLALTRCLDPPALAVPLEAKVWQHSLTGLPYNQRVDKLAIRFSVEARTGYRFQSRCTEREGGHDSDAAGIALVALDRWKHLQRERWPA